MDLIDGGETLPTEDGLVEGAVGGVNVSVKMKLNSLLRDGSFKPALFGKLNAIVADGNVLLAEGYAFANFHVLRLLEANLVVPVIDRGFYYRCLLAVSDTECNDRTLGVDFRTSIEEFDQLRPDVRSNVTTSASGKKASEKPGKRYDTNPLGLRKVDTSEYNQLVATLSIQMATMGSNHLITNLRGRLSSFLVWKHPSIKRFHHAILKAVLETPSIDVNKIMMASSLYKAGKAKKPAAKKPSKRTVSQKAKAVAAAKATAAREVKAAREKEQRDRAAQVAQDLRAKLPMQRPLKFASRAHESLRLYHWILKQTEEARDVHRARVAARIAAGETIKQSERYFKGRTFNLLPMKNSFTTASIPISTMFFLRILRSLKLSTHVGDGRELDSRALWDRFMCLKLVETANRKFDGSITTDGYAVSAVITSKVSLDTSKGASDSTIEAIRTAIKERKAAGGKVKIGAADPGFSDIVSTTYLDGRHFSYSSSRYYEAAKVKHSGRKTDEYNLGQKALTDTLRGGDGGKTSSSRKMKDYLRSYLASVRTLLSDRMTQNYRKQRFLRHVSKQRAVKEIVDLMVGGERSKTLTVIGFGDWSGGSRSPISRQHAGPIQMIKDKIGRRPNAMIVPVEECMSSKLDSNTWLPLVNMRAKETIRKRKDGLRVTLTNQKVHKVLHCQTSEGKYASSCRETTWNRDVNASKNLLMLLMMQIKGYDRPEPFRRQSKKA